MFSHVAAPDQPSPAVARHNSSTKGWSDRLNSFHAPPMSEGTFPPRRIDISLSSSTDSQATGEAIHIDGRKRSSFHAEAIIPEEEAGLASGDQDIDSVSLGSANQISRLFVEEPALEGLSASDIEVLPEGNLPKRCSIDDLVFANNPQSCPSPVKRARPSGPPSGSVSLRRVKYTCFACNEDYHRVVDENPGWAVYKHRCPHCKQIQIPRIDINVDSNVEDVETALDAEGDASSAGGTEVPGSLDQLTEEEASQLLVLMCHARLCNGIHAGAAQAEACKSTKFIMLHVRDCKRSACPFPWCRPCKGMLSHITQCGDPKSCAMCNPG